MPTLTNSYADITGPVPGTGKQNLADFTHREGIWYLHTSQKFPRVHS